MVVESVAAVAGMSFMLITFIYQFLGFFTPYWSCKLPDNITDCTVGGLFYNVEARKVGVMYQLTEICHLESDVLDTRLIGLCAASFIVTILTTSLALKFSYDQLVAKGRMKWKKCSNRTVICFIVFVIGQVLAFAAGVILLSDYDRIGWSATIFTAFGFLVFIILFLFANVLCVICVVKCCKCC